MTPTQPQIDAAKLAIFAARITAWPPPSDTLIRLGRIHGYAVLDAAWQQRQQAKLRAQVIAESPEDRAPRNDLARRIHAAGMNWQGLALAMRVSMKQAHQWYSGAVTPSPKTWRLIMDAIERETRKQ